MANVKFLTGTQAAYDALASKDSNNFYRTENNLYLGDKKLTNLADVEEALTFMGAAKVSGVWKVDGLSTTVKTSLVAAINELTEAKNIKIEDTADNYTSTTVEGALAEIATKISNATKGAKVTVETPTDATYAKVYEFYQGVLDTDDATVKAAKKIATINIPLDMVVSAGTVSDIAANTVEVPGAPGTYLAAGTYLVLTIANATSDKVYIPVDALIEYVTGDENTETKVTVDSDYKVTVAIKEISATKIIYKDAIPESYEGAGDGVAAVTVKKAIEDLETAVGAGLVWEDFPVAP